MRGERPSGEFDRGFATRRIWGERSLSSLTALATASGGPDPPHSRSSWCCSEGPRARILLLRLVAGILEMAAPNSTLTSVVGLSQEPGFAKLQGANFEYFMQAYFVILGRNTEKSKVDLDLSVIGACRSRDVSRRHARIFYDFEHRHFALEVLGKKGCSVQGVLHLPGSAPVKLNTQDLIETVGIQFYFLLPRRSIQATLAARRTHSPSQPQSSSLVHPDNPGNSAARQTYLPLQPQSSSFKHPDDPGHSASLQTDPPLQPQLSSYMRPEYPGLSYGVDYGQNNVVNGIKISEMQGKFIEQSKRYSGELGISYSHGINADPVATPGEHVNSLEIIRVDKDTDNQRVLGRADKDADNQQLLLKEEKDVVAFVATEISVLCGPGQWVPMAELHSKVLERYGKIWPHRMVQRYLSPPLSAESVGKPWCNLLSLLRKHPKHFVTSTLIRGEVVTEHVGLISLLS